MDWQNLEDPQYEEHHRRDEKQDQTENQEHIFAGEKVSTIMRRVVPFLFKLEEKVLLLKEGGCILVLGLNGQRKKKLPYLNWSTDIMVKVIQHHQ